MKITYRREIKHNYLVVDPEGLDWQGYETQMLLANPARGILRFRLRQADGQTVFYYEITSRQPLARLLENHGIQAEEIRRLLTGIFAVLEKMEACLLREESILLEPEYLYVEPEDYQVWLCLIPGLDRDFRSEFGKFLEYLLGKADHQDKDSVMLAYSLYQETRKENFGLENLEALLGARRKLKTTEDVPELLFARNERSEIGSVEQRQQRQQRPTEKGHWRDRWRNWRQDRGMRWWRCPGRQSDPFQPPMGRAEDRSQLLPERLEDRPHPHPLEKLLARLRRGGNREEELPVQPVWEQMFREPGPSEDPRQEARGSIRGPKLMGDPWQEAGWGLWEPKPTEDPRQEAGWGPWEPKMGLQEPKPENPPAGAPDTVLLADHSRDTRPRILRSLQPGQEDIPVPYYPFLIGKQENLVDFPLREDTVSRLHLRIDREGGEYRIQDLNSTNGTYLRGRLLENNEAAALSAGDEVVIAGFRYRFE